MKTITSISIFSFILITCISFYFLLDIDNLINSHKLFNGSNRGGDFIFVDDYDDYDSIRVNVKLGTTKITSNVYVSLVCDDGWVDQAAVLAMSWKKSHTKVPLVFLTLPFVTRERDLIALGGIIHRVDPLEFPKERSDGSFVTFNKACRYAKIHAWGLSQYNTGIFIDPDAIIAQVRNQYNFLIQILL